MLKPFLLLTFLSYIAAGDGFLKSVHKIEDFIISPDLIEDPILEFLFDEVLPDSNKCQTRPSSEKPNYYYFLPAYRGTVKSSGDNIIYEGSCFKRIEIVLKRSNSTLDMSLQINATQKSSYLCKESIFVGTSNLHQIKVMFLSGIHQVSLSKVSNDDIDEIKLHGIRVFTFCQGFFASLRSLFRSLSLYVGGLGQNPAVPVFGSHVPSYMVNSNKEFLETFANFKQIPRINGDKVLPIQKTDIKTGDFIAISRLDGLDPLIMLGTGSHIGHSAVACWIDGELYILESQDGWYWPKRGIQRNRWDDWIKWANNADFAVSILPLSEESRQKLNITKALQFFESVEGLEYGYRNFLFSWIDTPDKNFPHILDVELVVTLFGLFEKIVPSAAQVILGEALNMRLNTTNLTVRQTVAEASRRGMTFEQMIATVEKEGWEYTSGKNYVCSCFVVAFWKSAGLFGDLKIEATEFTPKDVYQLKIYDSKPKLPEACQMSDPDLPYCQITGKFKMTLKGYNSIEMYSHMNERCPSLSPDYIRPDGC